LENEHVHHEDTTCTALTNNRSSTTPAGGGGGAANNKNTTAAPVTRYYKPILYSHLSFLSKAKQAATDAILAVLKEEALTMQTTAKPSDVWLDRACAFEEAKDCRLALLKYRVPPLMTSGSSGISRTNHQNDHYISKGNAVASKYSESSSRFKQETEYYKRGMNALMNEGSSAMRHNTRKQEETGLLDDDGSVVTSVMNQSVASGRITAYTIGNYSIFSQNTQGTASYRRRQRQIRAATSSLAMKVKEREEIDHDGGSDDDEQQQRRRRRQKPGHDDDNGLVVFKTSTSPTTTPYEPQQMGSTLYYGREMSTSSKSRRSSRQHFMSGGLSYICEMVHDAYGLGSIHKQSNNIYPKVENVCDLFYRGSDELAVGL
jgi:hypothetical protein